MFSQKEKQYIADEVEKVLLSLNHPEMPKDKPYFELFVRGVREWSWANIKPNWSVDTKSQVLNLWNEQSRDDMKKSMGL